VGTYFLRSFLKTLLKCQLFIDIRIIVPITCAGLLDMGRRKRLPLMQAMFDFEWRGHSVSNENQPYERRN